MKNFTKLLMAVVLLTSYSCVQDTTEDLAPVITDPSQESGSGVVRTLQVALPTPSRTELGERNDDGKYPVYWETGDVLAVNGEPTTSISIVEDNRSVAVFDMPLETSIPYNIVYPYNADLEVDTQSGMYPVKFLSEQVHTEGTFASGSAPMYAWSDGFTDVQMSHLSTVLRFPIKAATGETISLKYVSVSTAEAEPIAGIFDVYCGSNNADDERRGEIKARKGATSTVFCTTGNGEPFSLTDQPMVFHLVVPKGAYTRFDVNFVAEDGSVCVRTFDATGEGKELVGGTVREFPEQTFEANSKVMIIGRDVDMLAFAEAVVAGEFDGANPKYSGGALLVTDIDVTDLNKSETPLKTINGFTSVFEGRGYTIKGLNEPLFGENTVATISNVNVEGNIVEESNGKVGLIARSLVAEGDKVGKIFNCSASGSITYNNPTLTIENNLKLINVGGVVGGVYGANVSLNRSNVTLTVEAVAPAGVATEFQPCIGGVAGYICAENDVEPIVAENENSGAVVWNDSSNNAKVQPYIGGVAGYVVAGAFTDNTNAGNLDISQPMYDLDWGGVLGASNVTIQGCKNEGIMTIDETITIGNIGGVLGRLEKSLDDENPSSIKDCDNYGKLMLNSNFLINKSGSCNIGGVVSYAEVGTREVSGCDNYGEINYSGTCDYVSASADSGNAIMRLGGVVGYCCSEILSNCNNAEGANVYVGGSVASNRVKRAGAGRYESKYEPSYYSSIAGVVAFRYGKKGSDNYTSQVVTEKCSNSGRIECAFTYCAAREIAMAGCIGILESDKVSDCHNAELGGLTIKVSNGSYSGDSVVASPTTTRQTIYIAGLICNVHSKCDIIENCSNSGDLIYDEADSRDIGVSGIIGYSGEFASIQLKSCYNNGTIKVGSKVRANSVFVAGILSNTGYCTSLSYPECYNSGNVIVEAEVFDSSYVGGIFGTSALSNPAPSDNNRVLGVKNTGTVKFVGSTPELYMGGFCGHYEEMFNNIEFINGVESVVSLEGSSSQKIETANVGGFVGYARLTNEETGSNGDFAIENKGTVKLDKATPNVAYVSGCIGNLESYVPSVSGIVNSGTVEITGSAETIYAGGCVSRAWMAGNATLGSSSSAISNSGVVDVAVYAKNLYVAGGVGYLSSGKGAINVANTANVKVAQNPVITEYPENIWIGGVCGFANIGAGYSTSESVASYAKAIRECTNSGVIEYKGIARDGAYVGGVVAQATNTPVVDCHNTDGASVVSTGHAGDWASRVTDSAEGARRYKQMLRHDLAIGGIVGETDSDVSGCGNNGAVTHTCLINPLKDDEWGEQSSSRFDIGGVVGRVYTNANGANTALNLSGLTNSEKGAITIYGSPTSTTNTSSYGVTASTGGKESQDIDDTSRTNTLVFYRMNVAGIVGRILDDSNKDVKCYINNCVNHAPVSVPEASTAKNLNIAGVAGDLLASHLTFNDCRNSGRISVEQAGLGTSAATTAMYNSYFTNIGGIVALYFDFRWRKVSVTTGTVKQETLTFNNCTNSGDLYYGETGASFFQTAGGILAQVLHYIGDYYSGTPIYYCDKDVRINNCTNEGNIQFFSNQMGIAYNYAYAGGIVGNGGVTKSNRQQRFTAYDLTIDGCVNKGSVQFDRSNGYQSPHSSYAYSAVGGIVGFYCGGNGFGAGHAAWSKYGDRKDLYSSYNAQIISCENHGRIHGFAGTLGGIIGMGYWFVNITGTEARPTINTGDIVVATDDAGRVRLNNWYGPRVTYAGGIAGTLVEHYSDTRYLCSASSTNEGWPAYPIDAQYARVEYAVNKGRVGATGAAGGIVGQYRSLKFASEELKPGSVHPGGIEFCRNEGNIYSLEGATGSVGAIVGSKRAMSLTYNTTYSSETIAEQVAAKTWPLGVSNCEVAGTILRGAGTYTTASADNYQDCIYGETWKTAYSSVIADKPYDGCVFYSTTPDAGTTPDDGTTTPDDGTTTPEDGTTTPDGGTTPEEDTTTEDSNTPNDGGNA
ncbi:MAG: hypothetical protein IKA04_09570 [Alistipes sp.]|nr:hypothetical protein [Alistipes sp.]